MVEIGQDKWRKGRSDFVTKKNKRHLGTLRQNPRQFPAIFLCKCAPWPITYIPSFIQIRSGFTFKTPLQTPE